MEQFETLLGRIILNKPPQFPYTEVAEKLNNLKPSEMTEAVIQTIVYEGEVVLPHYRKWNGKKKLYNMLTNTTVKEIYKKLYNIQD